MGEVLGNLLRPETGGGGQELGRLARIFQLILSGSGGTDQKGGKGRRGRGRGRE